MDNSQVPNSPEAETELTPTRSQPCRSRFPITNGLLKGFQPLPNQPPSQPRFVDTTNYRECLRNHAASAGGLVIDGCGGYIAPYSSDPSNPVYMKCMVCGCHRNYHRIEKDDHPAPPPPTRIGQLINTNCGPPSSFFPTYYPPPHRIVLNGVGGASPMAYPGAGPADNIQSALEGGISGSKKRRRTKFSSEQKVRMRELAEKIEWKMKKGDEEMIEAFCGEVGVERNVFKVWINNNKCTLGKRNAAGNGVDCRNEEDTRDLQLQLQDEGNDAAITTTSPHGNVANVSSSSEHEID